MLLQWLVLYPHREKELIQSLDFGVEVPVYAWVFSRWFGYFPQSSSTHVRLNDVKLPLGVSVSDALWSDALWRTGDLSRVYLTSHLMIAGIGTLIHYITLHKIHFHLKKRPPLAHYITAWYFSRSGVYHPFMPRSVAVYLCDNPRSAFLCIGVTRNLTG